MKIVFSQNVFSVIAIISLLLGLISIEIIEGWYYIGIVCLILLYLLNLFFIENDKKLKYILIIFFTLVTMALMPSFIHEKPIGTSYYEAGGTMSNPIEMEGYKTDYKYLVYFDKREINFFGLTYAIYLFFTMLGVYKEIIIIERRNESTDEDF